MDAEPPDSLAAHPGPEHAARDPHVAGAQQLPAPIGLSFATATSHGIAFKEREKKVGGGRSHHEVEKRSFLEAFIPQDWANTFVRNTEEESNTTLVLLNFEVHPDTCIIFVKLFTALTIFFHASDKRQRQ